MPNWVKCEITAKCPPLKIMETLSKKLLGKMIKFHFTNENYDGDHYILYKNGKIITEKNHQFGLRGM